MGHRRLALLSGWLAVLFIPCGAGALTRPRLVGTISDHLLVSFKWKFSKKKELGW